MPRDVDQSGKRRIIGLKNINRNLPLLSNQNRDLPLLSNQNWDLQYHRCPIRTEIYHSCPIRTEICHCCPIRTQIYHFCPIEIRDSPASKQTVNCWGHRFNIIYKWNINLNYLIKTKSFPVRGGGGIKNKFQSDQWGLRLWELDQSKCSFVWTNLLGMDQSDESFSWHGPIRQKIFLVWTNRTNISGTDKPN